MSAAIDGSRENYERVVEGLGLLSRLSRFDPMLIGTPPLGLAVTDSDIDVACFSSTLDEFRSVATSEFHGQVGFATRIVEWVEPKAALVTFQSRGWTVELFCQTIATVQQVGVRHFLVEQRLLALEPALRPVVRSLKEVGFKTEAAFATALGLSHDPYQAILGLEHLGDDELRQLVRLARLPSRNARTAEVRAEQK